MTDTMTITPEKLSEFLNPIKAVDDDAILTISPDGWHILMVDSGNSAMLKIDLPVGDFVKYHCEKEWDAGIIIDKMELRDNIRKKDEDEIGTGDYNFSFQPVNKQSITHVGITRGMFEFSREMFAASSYRKTPSPTIIDAIRNLHTHEFKMDTETLREVLYAIHSVGEYVYLEGTGNRLHISAGAEGDTCNITLPTHFTQLKTEEAFKSLYSMDYLIDIIKAVRTNELTIRAGTVVPLEIDIQIGNHGTGRYLLAPRVDD